MRKALIILFSLLLLCTNAFAAEANLVANPGFDSVDSALMPEGWYADMWDTSTGSSYLEMTSDGFEGNGILIKNAAANDSRFCQQIAVEPDTLYEFRCMAKADGISEEGKGANLSVLGTFSYSNMIYDTDGEWVELIFYGRTGSEQTGLTLCARLGGYSGTTTGSAWFDSISVRKVDSVPAGYFEQDISPVVFSSSSEKETAVTGEPARYTETWLLAAFGMALAFIAVYRKHERFSSDSGKNAFIFACVLAAAFVIRLFIAYSVFGYHTDINCFSSWGERMLAEGPADFYSEGYFCDYPPVYMLVLGIVAAVRNVLGIPYHSAAHVLLIKLIPIMFDILLAVMVYIFTNRRAGTKAALLSGLICALNPAAIIDSAAWGQIDSVFVLMTVLAAVLMCERKYHFALPLITIAVFTKPQTLLFGPLGLFAIGYDIIRGLTNREERSETIKSLIRACIGIAVSCVLLAAAALIFHIDGTNPFVWVYDLFFNTLNGYSYITINAFNLYELLGLNWVKLEVRPGIETLAWILFAFSYAYSFAVYAFAKRRSALYLSAATLIMLICTFGPMIHERYVYPAIVLLLFAYAEERDWRLIVSLGILSVTLFMNQVLVLQGGMTPANYGHLQSSEAWLNSTMSALTVANALFMMYTSFDIAFVGHRMLHREPSPAKYAGRPIIKNEKYRLGLKRADVLIMTGVTLAYSVVAFTNLGTLNAPETQFMFTQSGESVVFDLGQERTWRMEYYGGICNTTFTVEISNDGENWTAPVTAVYDQGEIFRWLYFVPSDNSLATIYADEPNISLDGTTLTYATRADKHPFQTSRYARVTAKTAGLILTEIGFVDAEANVYPVEIDSHFGYLEGYQQDPGLLIDEQKSVPEAPSYLNSTYFDEIYHARTAYEHQNGLNTYEWTHPPLGKVMIMLGIEIFGMTPFGWRFMGALAGVLMLPLMYLIAKQLGATRGVSTLAMLLMSFDSMHFTQTRIATIDSFSVFWIMLMYLFMFRYIRMNFRLQPLWKTLIPLALCGITMGIAWATKWIGIYASAGLVVLFFWSFIRRYIEHRAVMKNLTDIKERSREMDMYWRSAFIITGVCIVFFIIVPVLIYYCSYYWHMEAEFGFSFSRQCIERVIRIQENIFNYHSGLGGDTHYFRSPWYEWPVIAWPMWYYSGTDYVASGMVSSISCMGNPAVWWTGLAAMVITLVRAAWKRRADSVSLFIIIGFLSQYLPWVLVPRSTFIYHYFASVPFIILATAFMLGRIEKRSKPAFAITAGALVIAAMVLFAMFYPLESGLPVTQEYAYKLSWFDWYNSTASSLRR